MFKKMVEKSKNQRALAIPIVNCEDTDLRQEEKPRDIVIARSWTYQEYYDDCILAAKGLIGVKGCCAFYLLHSHFTSSVD